MKNIKLKDLLNEAKKIINKEGPDIFYHGSSTKLKSFKYPLWITTSRTRASMFSVSMKYSSKLNKNRFRELDGSETGYVYTIEVSDYKIIKMQYDERILIGASDIKIKKIQEVAVKKSNAFRRDWDYYIK